MKPKHPRTPARTTAAVDTSNWSPSIACWQNIPPGTIGQWIKAIGIPPHAAAGRGKGK